MAFPFSAGEDFARTPLPAGACDCHIHLYDGRVPAAPGAKLFPPDASVRDYRQIQSRMGTMRAVVVTPSTYGCDNTAMLYGLADLGDDARGVAVISGRESQAHLRDLHARGVRGARINLSLGTTHDESSIGQVAEVIAPLGWHLQLLMPPDRLPALAGLLARLPVDIVFDHMGRSDPEDFRDRPSHRLLLDWLSAGRAWIKLSGGYLVSRIHSSEDPRLDALARSFIEVAPDRVVWGSDWPHATASAGLQPMPDDARQIDALARWAVDSRLLEKILVHNPERLYGFPSLRT